MGYGLLITLCTDSASQSIKWRLGFNNRCRMYRINPICNRFGVDKVGRTYMQSEQEQDKDGNSSSLNEAIRYIVRVFVDTYMVTNFIFQLVKYHVFNYLWTIIVHHLYMFSPHCDYSWPTILLYLAYTWMSKETLCSTILILAYFFLFYPRTQYCVFIQTNCVQLIPMTR